MSDIPASFAPTPSQARSWPRPRLVHTITDRFSMANTYLICEPRLVVVNPRSSLNVHLLYDYMKNILRRPVSDIDLIVLTFLHPDLLSSITSIRQVCSAPIAAPTALYRQFDRRQYSPYSPQNVSIDLWLDDGKPLPDHPDWHAFAYPQGIGDNLLLHNDSTRELICGSGITVFEGNPVLRYERDMGHRQLEELLHLARSFDALYLYPARGRQLLRTSPFAQVRVD